MKTMRTLTCLFLLLAFFAVIPQRTARAGNFSLLASTGILKLDDDQAWEKSYKTSEGKFKIRFRKLWNASAKKKYHLIVWWDGKRIADGYCPKTASGYSFNVFRDTSTDRIFFALETWGRVVLMGYETANGRLEKYADSVDYYSPLPNPELRLSPSKDLMLTFVGNGRQNPTRYQLFWDEPKRWFGYRDVTIHPEAPSEEAVYAEPDEGPYEGTVWEAPSAYEEPNAQEKATAYEELYYEEKTVVNS